MKFVHIADIHFDQSFTTLDSLAQAGEERRLDQRKAFRKVIEYVRDNKIPYLWIAGDLYENETVRESTIQNINTWFQEIPETKVFIAPGNHDPYIKNSYYETYPWYHNVVIVKPGVSYFEEPDFDLYTFGFGNFYDNSREIENLNIRNKDKINVLLMHANLDGSKKGEQEYNPILRKTLQEKGFDYVALGHIHKSNYAEAKEDGIVYPGSLLSLGFDELGAHGMIVGSLEKVDGKTKLSYEFVPVDEKEFQEIQLDVSGTNTIEELIEMLNDLPANPNYKKIILTGRRNFEIDISKLRKNCNQEKILKIKDETKLQVDFEKEINTFTLKGLFIKEAYQAMATGELTQKEIEKALEIGLEVLE